MIIGISGSVGSGKTTIAREFSKKNNFELIELNELAKSYKIGDVKELQTFDFDLDALLIDLEEKLEVYRKEDKKVVLEGHFAHFINPDLVDILFVINRDLKELKTVYDERGYNEQKIEDNLEVEAMNLCFYEAIEEGYEQSGDGSILNSDLEESGNIFTIDNKGNVEVILDYLTKFIN